MNLNIIGNGFDIYHGLPCRYYHFGCFLIKEDFEYYFDLGDKYGFITRKYHNEDDYDEVVENHFWSYFEEKLGDLNEWSILGSHNYDLNLENDDPIEIDMSGELEAQRLINYFIKWILTTVDNNKNYRIIKKSFKESDDKIDFDLQKDYFVNFNYTHSLQKIYQIPENHIFYIHGECESEYSNLIVGHGNESRIHEIEEIISNLENDYDYTQETRNEIDEYNLINNYLKELKKPINECMRNVSYFYESHKNIDVIRIFGLSLGTVDLPYIYQLNRFYSGCKWEFHYYSEADKTRCEEVAKNLNLDAKYLIFKSIKSDNLCKNLMLLNNVEEYKTV